MAVREKMPPREVDGACLNNIISEEEFYGAGKLFSHITLAQGAHVDWHVHNGVAEYYYILSGRGIYTDVDGTEKEICAGKVCTICPGDGHAIRNPYPETLEFIALIISKVNDSIG